MSDPRGSCFYARLALETAVKWMYRRDTSLRSPYDNNLSALIHEPTFRKLVGNGLVTKTKIIKDYGNRAVHDSRAVAQQASATVLRELFHFSYWLVRTYARGAKPEADLRFSTDALPQTQAVEAQTLAKLQEIAKRFADKEKEQESAEAARLESEAEREKLEAEIAALRAEVAEAKKANQAVPDTHDYNEAETRDAFIDLLLHEAGWQLDQERDREFSVTGMPNNTGEGFVDYVLWGDDGKPLALVEAKRTKRDPREGERQAELYADCLEKQFFRRPVIFLSNGYEHWIWDDARYPKREIQGFLKKDELELLHQRRKSRKQLAGVDIDKDIAGRYYQTRAITRVNESFERDHLRKALLVMATGSGKTRTVIALIDQLMRAGWIKRALFLADRVALVNQAVGAFKKHLPHVAPVNLVTDKSTEGRVYVSTYPTMMGLIDDVQNGVRRFGSGHFDLIVIDEAHRSVYRKYRAIFDYFDGLLVGLTATPRDEIDRDTYSLFELERGVPTDSYDLDEAVADGFLVPPRAVSVPLKFQREGINYDDLSEDEKEQWDALEWTEDGDEVPDRVDAAAVNKWLFNEDTVDKVLEHLMRNGQKVADGDRLGKTIIFAKNRDHAAYIQKRFDANYPHHAGKFARVIDFKTEYAQSLIDDFSNAEKAPYIAISVDMLDTGIDVPEVVNLVFFKIVRSKTKFWQMIGRGTRLCPNLFAPGEDKGDFFVFDFCQNFEFFNQNPNVSEGALGDSLGAKLFKARVDLIGVLDDLPQGYDTPENLVPFFDLRKALAGRLHEEVSNMSLDNFIVRPKRRAVEKFQVADAWEKLSTDDRLELIEQIAGLPSALVNDDIAAKQFDLLLLRTQLALLQSDLGFASLQRNIRSIASQLEELANVPMVAAQMALIQEVQTDEYWQDITAPMLETARRRLRDLIKLIEAKARKIIYSDFEDEIGAGEEIDLPDIGSGTDKKRFLMKVRHFLAQNENHITIQKLRRNEQLTPQDLEELERIFLEEAVASTDQLAAIKKEGGLGLFIRSLVGLDREAAKHALAEFMDGRTLSANQIEFIDMIIDHLTEHGIMAANRLYESPFTDLDGQGVSGIFSMPDVKKLVSILKSITSRAAA